MRTILTTIGVTIGVASITAILSLSAGVTSVIKRQIDTLGGNLAVVRPAKLETGSSFISQQSYTASTLGESDYFEIQKLPGVKEVAPIMVVAGSVTAKDQQKSGTRLIGTTPELESMAGLELRDGQFIDTTTNQQTAVIGFQLSIDLFGTDLSIGKTFTVRGERFTVIGVLKQQTDPINFNDVDFDNTAIIHLEAAKKFNNGNPQIQQINVRAHSEEKLPGVINSINKLFEKTHNGEHDYEIISGDKIAEPASRMFSTIQAITIAVASISLLVGGIGIMNIMLVSVAERTREIGLRKAIGASNTHIIWQFLIESLIISIIGGVAGYFLGYIAAFAISTFIAFSPVFTLEIVGIAILLSVVVGVLFGIYPALRASQKNPIESLRRYH